MLRVVKFTRPPGAGAPTPGCRLLLAWLVCLGTVAIGHADARAITPDEVVEMTRAGATDTEITNRIASDGTVFDLSLRDVANLRLEGVSDAVLGVMQGAGGWSVPKVASRVEADEANKPADVNAPAPRTVSFAELRYLHISGASEDLLLQIIRESIGRIPVETLDVVRAREANISEAVIKAILLHNRDAACSRHDHCGPGYRCSASRRCTSALASRGAVAAADESHEQSNSSARLSDAGSWLVAANAGLTVTTSPGAAEPAVAFVGSARVGGFLADSLFLGLQVGVQYASVGKAVGLGLYSGAVTGTYVPLSATGDVFFTATATVGVAYSGGALQAGESQFAGGGSLGVAFPIGDEKGALIELGVTALITYAREQVGWSLAPSLGVGIHL